MCRLQRVSSLVVQCGRGARHRGTPRRVPWTCQFAERPPPTHTPGAHTAHWRVERALCMVVQTSYLIRSHMCVSVRVSLSVCVICLRSASTPKKVKVLTTTSSGHTDNTTDGANLLHVRAGDEYDLASLHTGAAGGWRPGSRKRSLEIRCSVQYRGAPLSHSTSPR